MAPIVTLRREVDREALLSAFCDTQESSRYDLTSPFGHGQLTYASDSRHICRAEIANRIENGERRLPGNLNQVWDCYWKPSAPLSYFELPRWQDAKLANHGSSQYVFGVCPECGDRRISFGDEYPNEETMKRLEAKYGYDIDDNTYRDPKCQACKGKDWTGPWLINVCGVPMDYTRMKPIAALPNVRVAASQYDDGASAIIFEADGFEGIAMGVQK